MSPHVVHRSDPRRPELEPHELGAWRGMLRVHSALVKALDAELIAAHGLPLTSYEVLINLQAAPGRRRRMAELADGVLLSRSGTTRLVDRLERDGLLVRDTCDSDGRGCFAVLTDQGEELLSEARATHLDGVRERFLRHFEADELEQIAACWERAMPGAGASCRSQSHRLRILDKYATEISYCAGSRIHPPLTGGTAMTIVRWEPLRELGTLQSEMNRLFNTVFDAPAAGNGGTLRRWMPAMDLLETGDHFVLRADLPGMTEEDVTIELEDDDLTDLRRAQGRARDATARATTASSARSAPSRAR